MSCCQVKQGLVFWIEGVDKVKESGVTMPVGFDFLAETSMWT